MTSHALAAHILAGCRILIVEDEYFLADDARSVLTDAGADVLGPVATVAEAHVLIGAVPAIDAVLLDINLRGEMAFAVADALRTGGIPFAFVTGYDAQALPARFAGATTVAKPVGPEQLVDLFAGLTASKRS